VCIVRVSDDDPDRLRYLAELGLVPGVVITIERRQPYGGPMSLTLPDAVMRDIGPALGAVIFAERV
jgi:DtxR family Mn-dependent transcriptional regulator